MSVQVSDLNQIFLHLKFDKNTYSSGQKPELTISYF
jgi:hypothetical protein